MKLLLSALSVIIVITLAVVFYNKVNYCKKSNLDLHSERVFECFLKTDNDIAPSWKNISKTHIPKENITIETYEVISQFWPDNKISNSGTIWKHKLTLYLPDKIKSSQALLIVGKGIRNKIPERKETEKQQLPKFDPELIVIAKESSTIVAELNDIPNQYLQFDNKKFYKEDGIVAYSMNKYMDDPKNNAYFPVHLPMVKSVIITMDAIQEIATQKNLKVENFVLSGASKRGWATWLTAIMDKRVNAIVPIVIDILNVQNNLKHIYNSYNGWPEAFHNYIEQKAFDRIDSPEFVKLMKIIDPISYLSHKSYKRRLEIPKYIINSSGDDFFVPDSLSQYLRYLPGYTIIRILPNRSHRVNKKNVFTALKLFYLTIINPDDQNYHDLTWQVNSQGELSEISINNTPIIVKLWQANNNIVRDFRFSKGIRYYATELTGKCNSNGCNYYLPNNTDSIGWNAKFVEISYKYNEEVFIITTPVFITQK